MADKEKENADAPEFDAHRRWKKLSAPMYDWMTNHHMVWPGLACRFGPCKRIDSAKYEQTIYFSDQVGQEDRQVGQVNKLVKQNLIIPEDGYSPMDHLNSWKENQRSPYFKKDKTTILHPGDCNKIMEVKQVDDVVVTHGDCEDVFVWHFERQAQANAQNKQRKGKSIPDVRLIGHTNPAPFALTTSSLTPTIASGGEDKCVLLWNLDDYAGSTALGLPPSSNSSVTRGQCTPGDTLQHQVKLVGHEQTVTSVCFKPGTDNTLMSTADDRVIKLWDVRQKAATCTIPQAATEDILCSDWSLDQNMVATGAGSGVTHVYDVRKFTASTPEGQRGAPMLEFVQYVRPPQAALTVAWSQRKPAWLATSGDDGRVCVYDTARPSAVTADRLPAQLVLQHIGHLGNIMDCQWSPHDDYTVMSVSNDGETYKEGGSLQLWRLSFLLHSPVEEAMSLLKSHQTWLETGKIDDIPKNVPPSTVPAVQATTTSAAQSSATAAAATAAPAAAPAAAAAATTAPAAAPAAAAAVDTTTAAPATAGAPAAPAAAPTAAEAPAAPAAEAAATVVVEDGGVAVNGAGADAGAGADESVATGVMVGDKDTAGDVDMQDA